MPSKCEKCSANCSFVNPAGAMERLEGAKICLQSGARTERLSGAESVLKAVMNVCVAWRRGDEVAIVVG